jgi:hypothetical protein
VETSTKRIGRRSLLIIIVFLLFRSFFNTVQISTHHISFLHVLDAFLFLVGPCIIIIVIPTPNLGAQLLPPFLQLVFLDLTNDVLFSRCRSSARPPLYQLNRLESLLFLLEYAPRSGLEKGNPAVRL